MLHGGWFRPIPVATGVGLLVVALVVVTVVDSPRRRTWAGLLLGLCVAGILALTLWGGSVEDGGVNLIPGHTISGEHSDPDDRLGLFNVVGNVAMFVPVGWLLAVLVGRRRVLRALFACVGLSMAIEVTQLFVGRFSDIDDVILNTTGAVLGACVALLIRTALAAGDSRTIVTPRGDEGGPAAPRNAPRGPSPSA
jgi:hypothetical protein